MNNKSILIIAYYWPPSSGVAGHRWLHMSNYLEKLGYNVHVIVPENPDYTAKDDDLFRFVSPKIKVTKSKNFEIRNIISKRKEVKETSELDSLFYRDKSALSLKEKIMLWVRGNIFIPDARITWYLKSKKSILNYVKTNKIDVLITTGTPHSLHLFGLFLKKRLNLKWIADFRDPWTTIEYHNKMYLSSFAKIKHKNLEKKVLSKADAVTTVSNSWAEEFKEIGANNVHVILNGYEESSFSNNKVKPYEDFIICHPGTLNEDRIPNNLFPVLSKLNEEGKTIKLHLYGNVSNKIIELINHSKLEKEVVTFNSVSHSEILKIMSKSTILLLLINKGKENSKGRIPAKLFEYIRTGKPVLLIGNINGDAAKIVNSEKLGKAFSYSDSQDLYKFLNEKYNLFLKNNLNNINSNIKKFSRESMANEFSKLIQAI